MGDLLEVSFTGAPVDACRIGDPVFPAVAAGHAAFGARLGDFVRVFEDAGSAVIPEVVDFVGADQIVGSIMGLPAEVDGNDILEGLNVKRELVGVVHLEGFIETTVEGDGASVLILSAGAVVGNITGTVVGGNAIFPGALDVFIGQNNGELVEANDNGADVDTFGNGVEAVGNLVRELCTGAFAGATGKGSPWGAIMLGDIKGAPLSIGGILADGVCVVVDIGTTLGAAITGV
jgi:hypothetical protein